MWVGTVSEKLSIAKAGARDVLGEGWVWSFLATGGLCPTKAIGLLSPPLPGAGVLPVRPGCDLLQPEQLAAVTTSMFWR